MVNPRIGLPPPIAGFVGCVWVCGPPLYDPLANHVGDCRLARFLASEVDIIECECCAVSRTVSADAVDATVPPI